MTATLALITGALVVAAPAMSAPSHEFEITSIAFSGIDQTPGDGVCKTAEGTCTLRAALEESNALNGAPGDVVITVQAGLSGIIRPILTRSAANWMQTSSVSTWDQGALYRITAPVTIDLDNRVAIIPSSEPIEAAAFEVAGQDVVLKNFSNILSSGTSIVMGEQAKRVSLTGGSTVTKENYFPERFIVYRQGASDISVSDYELQGFYHEGPQTSGLFVFNATTATPIKNISISRVKVDYTSGGVCNAADGSGCRTNLTTFSPRDPNVVLDGFSFTDSTVKNLNGATAFKFSSNSTTGVKLSNLDISGNQFLNSVGDGTGDEYAFITLPPGNLSGENRISRNDFVRATSGQTIAIRWDGLTRSGTEPSGLSITDNYFDGYVSSIRLSRSGLTTVSGNTFGIRSGSQIRPATAEETADGVALLVDNSGAASNLAVSTWHPTSNASVVAAPSSTALVATPRAAYAGGSCAAEVTVQKPVTGQSIPSGPVSLDLYWTADRTAEIYLGRVTGVADATASVAFSLPVGPQTLAGATVPTSAQAVNATTGDVSGFVRVQTHVETAPQLTSSQFSRTVAVAGNCRPTLTLDQAGGQNDPTMSRDLHYTLKSSLPLDPSTVTGDDVQLTAVATGDTLDAARINPRVVSVTPIAGKNGLEFDVVARVDDSATVSADVAVGRVTSTSGLTNTAPASSVDAGITFVNPLQVTSSRFTLVTGDEKGKSYAMMLRAGAPVPTSPLTFSSKIDAAGVEHGVGLSTSAPVIAPGARSTESIVLQAADGDVAANTEATIAATVASEDSNYDGLVVPSVSAFLFATDPTIEIEKRAYADVADTSTPETIEQTGTPALTGARLVDGQAVCFVYTVTNRSADDWTTSLHDVLVTDSDLRLGAQGVIGSISQLAVGESAKAAGCRAIVSNGTADGWGR
ncbi:hypothetical protein [Microbacterium sp. WCS2018Hpa-9]|uniref:hypothetical protein n=1 Tax=Microbacterium sp. WCS2018Hpa-9 TaxID=3073635 RepID=UPI00288C43DC|nr:hypothetical protein [Microbacterium sp. WCS2018Hpa-9]